MDWRDYLFAEDAIFERQCRLDATRGSGPGGQKRNKTSSAIRLTHLPTGISVRAEDSRSQKSNRRAALERLRLAIAFQLRAGPVPTDLASLNPKQPADLARFLDLLTHHHGSVSDAAPDLSATTAQVSRFISRNTQLLDHVNRLRAQHDLKPLRPRA
jgi:hypothetical protein